MTANKILITGANGQLGTELSLALAKCYGSQNVISSDILPERRHTSIRHVVLDVNNSSQLRSVVKKHGITQIYHLAAALSIVAENNPFKTWELNVIGLLNVLETAVLFGLDKIFWPSSIAVFGPTTPREKTSQHTITEPNTIYGITKLAGEGLCRWYFERRGVDIRSIRYPGIISHKAEPGGGTTDYAVDIFHHARLGKPYICPLEREEMLPMMYVTDAVRAALELMAAPRADITENGSYNVSGFSCSPECLTLEILDRIPDFSISYHPGLQQEIAKDWPDSVNDSKAANDWNWQPNINLPKAAENMLSFSSLKFAKQNSTGIFSASTKSVSEERRTDITSHRHWRSVRFARLVNSMFVSSMILNAALTFTVQKRSRVGWLTNALVTSRPRGSVTYFCVLR